MSETNPESAHLYRHIVVGVDSSDQSAAALHHACLLAEEFDARLTVVLVWSLPIGYDGVLASGTDIERNAETELATIVAQSVPERLKDRIRAITRSGAPAPVLIDESEEADLLVIGSRGRGGFRGLLLGSVSTQCAAHAKCPVLIHH